MDESQEILRKFTSKKSKYFDLPEGEERKIKFLSAEEVPNHFDGGKTILIRYHLEVDGIKLLWDRVSRKLSEQMGKMKEGDILIIKREGQLKDTKYFIKKVEE